MEKNISLTLNEIDLLMMCNSFNEVIYGIGIFGYRERLGHIDKRIREILSISSKSFDELKTKEGQSIEIELYLKDLPIIWSVMYIVLQELEYVGEIHARTGCSPQEFHSFIEKIQNIYETEYYKNR